MTPHLRLPMTPTVDRVGTVYMPHLWARLVREMAMSRPLRALVDSGAARTVASFEVAADLGLTAEALATLPTFPVGGLGEHVQLCHEARVDLYLGRGADSLLLRDAQVFFVPVVSEEYDLLLGQADALERLVYTQRNQPPRRTFLLREPD